MILYFSGTGNSQYVAEQIAEKTGDTTVSLNQLIKQNKKDALVSNTRPFVFVCPTYAWQIPRVVADYIQNTTFEGTQKVYFVLTCGGETANAIQYIKRICEEKGWQLQGFAEIVMPDNYIIMFPPLERAKAKEQIRRAEVLVHQIAEDIGLSHSFSIYAPKGFGGKLESSLVNKMFYPVLVKAKGFHTTEKCISCGKCVALCPLNNIVMAEKRPQWNNNCTHCMACICGCPEEAIEYKNKTQGKPRYLFSNFC